mgnify:CR=1 FL=1|tara:strand:- start:1040 stop:1840 length:801 start_codon:yes stop_codon:yes gene_type:complete
MLSIEQLKLLIDKLERAKKVDYQELIDSNLKILKDIAMAVDANNQQVINRLDRTPEWFTMDIDQKRKKPVVDPWLFRMIQTKIYQFSKNSGIYHSLEIGPGTGMFSKEFKAWEINYFVDVNSWVEKSIRKKFPRAAQKYLKFYLTDRTKCDQIPSASCNFVFSWDTFVFLTQEHIKEYLKDIKRVMIQGGHAFIQYADCQNDVELTKAENTYWNYNHKSAMQEMLTDEGFEIVELGQFIPGASYAIFRKPGKQKPVVDEISEIKLD